MSSEKTALWVVAEFFVCVKKNLVAVEEPIPEVGAELYTLD